MEEILASIRRIISEDTEEEQAASDTPAGPAADADDGDVLELTQMIAEDGTTVDLTAEAAAEEATSDSGDAEPEFETGEAPETEAEAEAEPEPEAEDEPSPEAAHDAEPEPEIEPEPEPEVEPEPEPEIEEEPEPEYAIDPAYVSEPDESPTPAYALDPEVETETEYEAAPEIEPEESLEPAPAEPEPEEDEAGLLSQESAASSIDALAMLARATGSGDVEVPAELRFGESGRTIEELVVHMMRPMLREWLDENLPPIVERLVQRELRNLTRRAAPD